MADDTTTAIVVALALVMIVVTWFELRYMRKRSKSRRLESARKPEQLEDEAHNALLTTRAIVSTLAERGGIRSEDVDAVMREAQMAFNRHNYRVAIELTTKAKGQLLTLKAQQGAKGDLAKLDTLASKAPPEESTTKEVLQKDFPPNLVQSKFAIAMAETSIEDGRSAGRDVTQAQTLLAAAKVRFDAKDYSGALTVSRQAQKSARGETVEVTIPPMASPASPVPVLVPPSPPKPAPATIPVGTACPTCGAAMKPDDAFCRKCGTKVIVTNCPACGTSLLADDVFCRKCGTRIQR